MNTNTLNRRQFLTYVGASATALAGPASPTRGTVVTGRHYFRYGIWSANTGRLPREEYTVAQGLKIKIEIEGNLITE